MIRPAAFLIALLPLAASFSPRSAAAARPNILWILGDDLGPNLACYGEKLVRTPNIDRLAAQGARFRNAFTTAPVCSPSRSALMTGMYQTAIGAHQHRSHREDGYRLPTGIKTITERFREAGYFTANVRAVAPGLKVAGKTDFNFTVDRPFDGEKWDELKNRQPFFAEVNFFEPHRQWAGARDEPNLVDPSKVVLPPYYPDHPLARDDYAHYLDAIQLLDRKVDIVLRRLEEDGLADNTIVFFFGDNGQCHVRGKQWLYDAGLHIPLIVRWPGTLQPGTVRDDLVSAIDISATSLDLAGIRLPAGMQGQVFLGPNAREPRKYIFGARDRCDETVDRIRSVHTARYNYIRNFHPEFPYTQPNAYKERSYPVLNLMKQLHAEGKLTPAQQLFMAPRRPVEELYDLQTDPHEIHNLAESPKHREVLKDLRAAMEKWMKECNDVEGVPGEPR
jgi:N-sulfoglucosamine sulfohydrolase